VVLVRSGRRSASDFTIRSVSAGHAFLNDHGSAGDPNPAVFVT